MIRDLGQRYGTSPFLLSDAIGHGLTRARLRTAIACGALVRLRRDVYVLAGEWEHDFGAQHLVVARGVQLAWPDAVASHWTAVLAHDLPAPTRSDSRPAIPTLSHPTRSRRTLQARLVTAALEPRDVTEVRGLVVTGLARTGLDAVADRPLPHALLVLDAVARRLLQQRYPQLPVGRVVAESDLRLEALALLGASAGRRCDQAGARGLATAVALTDARSESPLESWSRAVFLLAGLPRPLLQLPVRGESRREYRADFAWPDQRVLGEADGMAKYADLAALRAKKLREDDLRRAGWLVVRWTWSEIAGTPEVVLSRVRRALAG